MAAPRDASADAPSASPRRSLAAALVRRCAKMANVMIEEKPGPADRLQPAEWISSQMPNNRLRRAVRPVTTRAYAPPVPGGPAADA